MSERKEIRLEEYIPILGRITINFTDISSLFYKHLEQINDIERLKSVNHLGLLAHVFPTLNHSRYDYMLLQMVLSEIIENSFRGTTTAQGKIKIDGKYYRGNDIIKTWIMMSNFGHCKRTIGDEKSLLLYASKRKGFLSELTKDWKDEALKEWAKKIVERFDYIRFHHIIAIYRIYKTFPRRLKLQKELIEIYKSYLLPSLSISDLKDRAKNQQLKTIFRNIRNLSIIALDSRNSHLPINIDILSSIVSFDFDLDRFQGKKMNELFNPLINLLYDKIYLHKSSQTIQRSYEIKALEELSKISYKKGIEKSINEGLAEPYNESLKHCFRNKYILKKGQSLIKHISICEEITKYSPAFESSVDFNLNTRDIVADFYIVKDKFHKDLLPNLFHGITEIVTRLYDEQARIEVEPYLTTLSQIAIELLDLDVKEERFNKLFEPSLNSLREKIQVNKYSHFKRLFRFILWALIRYHIKDKFYFEIESEEVNANIGYILEDGTDRFSNLIESKISQISDPDRVHELSHLKKGIKKII